MCPPVTSHVLFPLSRTPFYLFTWVSPPHLSRLSSGTISSQQHFLLPGQGRASSGPSAPSPHSHVSQVWGVLAFVHAHPPHRPWAPPSSDSQLSKHYSPPFVLCHLMLPPNPSESFPTSPLPHFCVPSFLAESELEKEQWLEAMQRAIAEALSTWEVAERIWAMAPNRFCADCGAAQPDWASINLCVVICKRCAGVWGGWGARPGQDRAEVLRRQVVCLAGGAGAKAVSESIVYEVAPLCQAFPTVINLHGRDSASHVMSGDTEAQRGEMAPSRSPGKEVSLDLSPGLLESSHIRRAEVGQVWQGFARRGRSWCFIQRGLVARQGREGCGQICASDSG